MLIQNHIKIESPGQLLQEIPLAPISRNLQIILKKFVTLKIFFLQKDFLVQNDGVLKLDHAGHLEFIRGPRCAPGAWGWAALL